MDVISSVTKEWSNKGPSQIGPPTRRLNLYHKKYNFKGLKLSYFDAQCGHVVPTGGPCAYLNFALPRSSSDACP